MTPEPLAPGLLGGDLAAGSARSVQGLGCEAMARKPLNGRTHGVTSVTRSRSAGARGDVTSVTPPADRSVVGPDHRGSTWSSIDVDHPVSPMTNAASTKSNRRVHVQKAPGDVGGGSQAMLRPRSTTRTPVTGRTPVPRHDRQRPARSISDSLEDRDEPRRRAPAWEEAVTALELAPGEVPGEVTHRPRAPRSASRASTPPGRRQSSCERRG